MQLTSKRCRLEPLTVEHQQGLRDVAATPVGNAELWGNPYTTIPCPGAVHSYISHALREHTRGRQIPFAIVITGTGEVVGTTRFQYVNLHNRRLQIGGTWLSPRWHKTYVNTETKLALLEYAFEALNCQRVEFAAHPDNAQSRKALERLGAKFEGILRQQLLINGVKRDSAVYSLIDDEWPGVRRHISRLLENYEFS